MWDRESNRISICYNDKIRCGFGCSDCFGTSKNQQTIYQVRKEKGGAKILQTFPVAKSILLLHVFSGCNITVYIK